MNVLRYLIPDHEDSLTLIVYRSAVYNISIMEEMCVAGLLRRSRLKALIWATPNMRCRSRRDLLEESGWQPSVIDLAKIILEQLYLGTSYTATPVSVAVRWTMLNVETSICTGVAFRLLPARLCNLGSLFKKCFIPILGTTCFMALHLIPHWFHTESFWRLWITIIWRCRSLWLEDPPCS